MKERTLETIAASNRYHCYIDGWKHGASTRAMDPKYTEHEKRDLSEAYELGYKEGQIARGKSYERGTELYGHEPEILRLA